MSFLIMITHQSNTTEQNSTMSYTRTLLVVHNADCDKSRVYDTECCLNLACAQKQLCP